MKKRVHHQLFIIAFLIFTNAIMVAQTNQITFPLINYDLNGLPRTQLSPMSIKLFDDYVTSRPSTVTAPGGNSYGTLLAIYGRSSHWESNLYFGASTKKLYFRTSAYSGHVAEDGTTGGFHLWRTILDSKSDVESSGSLKITGSGNHYISSGNVGIGTTTPNAKLEVGTTHAINQDDEMRIGSYYQSKFYGLGFNYKINQVGSVTKHLVSYEAGNRTTAMSFVGEKVGIGTTTPNSKLEVGVVHAVNQDEEMRIGSYYQNTFYGLGLNYRIDNSGDVSKHFVEYSGNTRYTSMTFKGGKVVIGTTTPFENYLLTVAGGIASREVKVVINAGADFVFNENYPIQSLEELEAFVKQNKHLPEIASAAEMENNGIELGEMNIKLLQKIEELTLYLIEQDKEVKSEKLKVERLEEENRAQKEIIKELVKRIEKLESKISYNLKNFRK
ncbi:MAG: hypothetical protein HC831_22355 [Chloroflexia bacterium]|nr:hypothetical protein [Chloroflexia bacterium]